MFTTVLHYDFGAQAAAIDVSGRNVHGVSTGLSFAPDAQAPERGAAVFGQPGSRIRTITREPFRRLTALKIEATVFLESTGARQNLVEGYLSFAFYVSPSGALVGTARAPESAGGAWRGIDSVANSPDGVARTVPFGRWCTLTYIHDGYTNLVLLIDGQPVATTDSAPAPLQTVGWRGVHIGNWPDADRFTLRGSVGAVRLWRWDPSSVGKQFATRPLAPCWADVGKAINVAGADRKRLAALYRCVIENQQRVIAMIRRRPDGRELVRGFAERYRELWAAGNIGGAEMGELLEHLLGELSPDERAAYDRAISAMSDCLAAIEWDTSHVDAIDIGTCDPDFVEYIRTFSKMVEA
ncbi:LamG domain-containing protein [Microbacterium sp. SLBN-146]|uniref:LamG domain-containing protein n=1 Tax=Microbacterium sp. SLBN-146 TaxID=2768457 RepID=UPI001151E012|nr:LamG domain-containing protein [Microbacterium sp. SLBN-146]TQJ30260.1 hypothetical protein FBY39_0707 [Microbacterium sp. SLBN-146]